MEIYRMLTGLGIPSCLSPGTSLSTLLVVAHFLIHLHDQLPTISGRVFGRSQALINDRLGICSESSLVVLLVHFLSVSTQHLALQFKLSNYITGIFLFHLVLPPSLHIVHSTTSAVCRWWSPVRSTNCPACDSQFTRNRLP